MKYSENVLSHLEALRGTLWRIFIVIMLFTVPCFYFVPQIIEELVRHSLPAGIKLHYFSPFEPLIIQLKLSLLMSLVLSLPITMVEVGRFIYPALHKNEKKWIFSIAILSLFLVLLGLSFAYFIMLPMLMKFSLSLAVEGLQPIIGIKNFLEMTAWLFLGFAITFQLPLLVISAVKLGFISCLLLSKSRPVILIIILFTSAILTPPDIVSQVMLAVPCWLLFEISLIIAKKIEKQNNEEENCLLDDSINCSEDVEKCEQYDNIDIAYMTAMHRKKKFRFIGSGRKKSRFKK